MKRSAFFLVAGLATSLGCLADQNPGSMQILGIAEAESAGENFECAFDDTEFFLASGSVDVLVSQWTQYLHTPLEYWGHVVIRNTLNSANPTLDLITLQALDIDLTYPYQPGDMGYNPNIDAHVAANSFYRVPVAATIAPGETTTLGFVSLLPGNLLHDIAEEQGSLTDRAEQPFVIISSIKAVGNRSTNDVESSKFDFPVFVCKGCMTFGLVEQVPCGSNPSPFPGDPCSGLPINQAVSCCWQETDSDPVPVCPDPSAITTEE